MFHWSGPERVTECVPGRGRFTVYPVAAPAAGANFTWSPPAGTRILLRGVALQFQTAAVAITRNVYIYMTTGAIAPGTMFPASSQAAGLTWNYHWLPGMPQGGLGAAIGRVLGTLPFPHMMDPTDSLTSNVTNIQGADQLSNILILTDTWDHTQ